MTLNDVHGTPKIIIDNEDNNNYYVSYFEDELMFRKKIISTYMSYHLKGNRSEIENYNGRYIQLWLMDPITKEIDDRFLAIGSSGNEFVYEFHFPYGYKIGIYFTPEENIINKYVLTYNADR